MTLRESRRQCPACRRTLPLEAFLLGYSNELKKHFRAAECRECSPPKEKSRAGRPPGPLAGTYRPLELKASEAPKHSHRAETTHKVNRRLAYEEREAERYGISDFDASRSFEARSKPFDELLAAYLSTNLGSRQALHLAALLRQTPQVR